MRGQSGRLRLAAVITAAVVAGACLAGLISYPASAATSYTWSAYNLSNVNGGVPATGQPSALPDPGATDLEDDESNSPSGNIIEWYGDGADNPGAVNVTSAAGGPTSTGSPSAVDDPQQTGHLLIFTTAGGGYLYEYDHDPSVNTWRPYDISSIAGSSSTITGSPSAVIATSNTLSVAVNIAGDLNVFTRPATGGGPWNDTDVSSATGQTISGDPIALAEPVGGGLDVFADTTSGHFVQFADESGTWYSFDFTSEFGGQEITGGITPFTENNQVYAFAEAPGGDLIEWTRAANGTWSSQNLTLLTGGKTIAGTPSVVADPAGGIDVFAQGSNEDLIEYSGSGTNWSGADLTAAGVAPTIDAAPDAVISPQAGGLVVYMNSAIGNEIEIERNSASSTTTGTSTSGGGGSGGGSGGGGALTVTGGSSTPTPTTTTPGSHPKPGRGIKGSVKVKPVETWKWFTTYSELFSVKLGKLTAHEGVTVACRGTGQRHRTGCPYVRRSATGKPAVTRLLKRLAKTRYGVGDVLTMTVSEPGLNSWVARLTIRSLKAPTYPR